MPDTHAHDDLGVIAMLQQLEEVQADDGMSDSEALKGRMRCRKDGGGNVGAELSSPPLSSTSGAR